MLTREFLLKADCKTAFGTIDDSLLLTCEQRTASLEAILTSRPDNSPVWIFGYGSLMWNPIFATEEKKVGTLFGWHRAFCMRLIAGRGTDCRPGRMLALKNGGETRGLAFRLPEASLLEELTLLWKREMVTGCYQPVWCPLRMEDGRQVSAIVFTINDCHPLYEEDCCAQTIAPLIARASGPLGTNADYLFLLEKELTAWGIQEKGLSDLVHHVRSCQCSETPSFMPKSG